MTNDTRTVAAWLADLGSEKPAPGGGAAAALLVATGAALVEMVTNLTIGKPRYAASEQVMQEVRARAADIRGDAQALADADEAAFTAVVEAYRIPREDPGRSEAIQAATAAAARPPLATAELAAEVVALAGRICEGANVNVLSDVAVAASSARAALESAAINVEINVGALKDAGVADALSQDLARHMTAVADADEIIAAVRSALSGS